MKKICCGFFLFLTGELFAQSSALPENKPAFSWSGYAEVYYAYDFNKPMDNNRPSFIYSHNRHNEFNLNLGFVRGSYNSERVRANLAFAAGTYVNANYAAEPGVLKNIYEANAGVRLGKKDLWLDAGIFSSHIGFESATSKDCHPLTRSIAADNSPYYEAGAKLTYKSDNAKWVLVLLALNGWQRIKRVDGNSLISWGSQVQFIPSDRVLINYSTFIGTDKPDSARLMRIFNNFYGLFKLNDRLSLTLGLDIGSEEKSLDNGHNVWYTPQAVLRYGFNEKWAIAGRVEYYNDTDGVIIGTGTPNGFQTFGYSMNIDYIIGNIAWVRIEGRALNSRDNIFAKGNSLVNTNTAITGSIAISL